MAIIGASDQKSVYSILAVKNYQLSVCLSDIGRLEFCLSHLFRHETFAGCVQMNKRIVVCLETILKNFVLIFFSLKWKKSIIIRYVRRAGVLAAGSMPESKAPKQARVCKRRAEDDCTEALRILKDAGLLLNMRGKKLLVDHYHYVCH